MTDIDHAAIGRVYADNLLGEPAVSRCLHAMADEIERLRSGAVEGCETVCPHVRGTVTQHCSLNVTLTDEERAAVEVAAKWCETPINPVYSQSSLAAMEAASTLRNLLERLN
jgi:hypothetical protein